MRTKLVATLAAIATAAALAGPAGAQAPPGHGLFSLTTTCDGASTTIVQPAGVPHTPVAWLSGDQVLAVSFSTTFGGGFTKEWGNRTGVGTPTTLTCDVFGETATVSVVDVPPGSP